MSFIHTLDAYIDDAMENQHIPGLSLAIVEDGRIAVEKSYGTAYADTVYELGTLSHSFIAVAILMLAQEGHLTLDDPITRYRVGLPESWQAITLRHLLTHTSGLSDGENFAPQFPAGSQAAYAETNYKLLTQVIHILTYAAVDVFFNDQFFVPYAMTATYYNGATSTLYSTLSDLLKWEAALMGGQLLPESALQEMFTPFMLTNGEPASFGLGCEIENFQGHKLVDTNGRISGFSSSITRFVDDGLTVMILANQDCQPGEMCKEIASLYDPALAE